LPFGVNTSFFKATGIETSPNAVIRVYDAAGNVIETNEYADEFREW
jgi:hypothetical protein